MSLEHIRVKIWGEEENPAKELEQGGGKARRQRCTAGLLQSGAGTVLRMSGTSSPRPIVKTIVEMHMKTEIQANIQVQTSESGQPHLVLSDCSNSQDSLTITLLDK